VKAQLMTVIVYGCAVVTVVFWGYTSDRTNQRSIPIMITSLIMATGYITNLATESMKPRFFSCILMAMGGFPVMLLQLMWMVINTVSYTKRFDHPTYIPPGPYLCVFSAVGLAMFNILGQLFGIAGNQSYRDPPLYTKGHLGAMAATLLNFVVTLACFFYLKKMNVIKRRRLEDPACREKVEEERGLSYDVIGDEHPDFFFTT